MSQMELPVPVVQLSSPVAAPAPTPPAGFDVAGRHVYFVGIGGCGMSGLARLVRARGGLVSGSDSTQGEATDALAAEGVEVGFDQARAWLPDRCDLVVISAAVRPEHPQVAAARARGIPVLTYAQALGESMRGTTGVAVAGTHGKSTTTAMLGAALVDAGLDPSVIVGATCAQVRLGSLGTPTAEDRGPYAAWASSGFRVGAASIPAGRLAGRPGVLVAEACEFKRSFLHLRPTLASISSVEADHLDVYGTLDAVVEAFRDFARLVPPADDGGHLLIAHDGAHRREVAAGLRCRVETIGFSPAADWCVSVEPGTRRVRLKHRRRAVAEWTMRLPGGHNAMNAGTAAALACLLGADPERIAASLGAFRGVDRRTQLLGERDGVRVYDDYGHHPTEIDATLRALREFERPEERSGRLVCVFQPHQHSRTRHLLDEFASAFSKADIVVVPEIYFVRDSESERHTVSAADLVDRLRRRGQRAMHLHPFGAIVEQLENLCRPGDLLVVMGAGPVYEVARGYLSAARAPRDARAEGA